MTTYIYIYIYVVIIITTSYSVGGSGRIRTRIAGVGLAFDVTQGRILRGSEGDDQPTPESELRNRLYVRYTFQISFTSTIYKKNNI
jgi:hypothetical protein